jgi:predicted transcriptional regulator
MTRPKNSKKAKLTAEKVLQILKYLDMGCSQQNLAKEFGVNQTLISAIKRGKTWKHISQGFIHLSR